MFLISIQSSDPVNTFVVLLFCRTIYFRLLSTCCVFGVKDHLVSVTLQNTVSQPVSDASPSVEFILACQFAIWEISIFLSGSVNYYS